MPAERDDLPRPLKRLNFFKGLIATENDWIEEEDYRRAKLRMHTSMLHGVGVVRGYAGELHVAARGDLSVEIQAGCAVDGQGREIIMWETQVKNFPDPGRNDAQYYLVIRFAEQPTDFIAYKHNLAIRGHRRLMETFELDVITREPNIMKEVELGRAFIEKNTNHLSDARDPLNPKNNELSTLYVPRAGVAGSRMSAPMRTLTDKMFVTVRTRLKLMQRAKVHSSHDAIAALLAAQQLHNAQMLDRFNMPEIMWPVVEMLAYMHDEIATYFPDLANKKELEDYFKVVKVLRRAVWESRVSDEQVKNLYLNIQRAADLIGTLAASVPSQQSTQIKSRRY